MFSISFGFTGDTIVDSLLLASISVGLDERIVWNKVDVFVCFWDSVEIYDFCRLMMDNFLRENCSNGDWFENRLYFLAHLPNGWLSLLPFLTFSYESLYFISQFFTFLEPIFSLLSEHWVKESRKCKAWTVNNWTDLSNIATSFVTTIYLRGK